MSIHRIVALASLFVLAPLTSGCIAGEDTGEGDVPAIDAPNAEEEFYSSTNYMACFHQAGYGMVCNYWGGGSEALWRYTYSTTPWTNSGIYRSGNTVNWGNCADPNGGPASFVIQVEAWNLSYGNYATLYMPCK